MYIYGYELSIFVSNNMVADFGHFSTAAVSPTTVRQNVRDIDSAIRLVTHTVVDKI